MAKKHKTQQIFKIWVIYGSIMDRRSFDRVDIFGRESLQRYCQHKACRQRPEHEVKDDRAII